MKLTRKTFLQSGAVAAAGLWLESCGFKASRGPAGADADFLRAYGPIDRTIREDSPGVFFGENPDASLHEVIRDGKFLMEDPVGEPRRERLVVIGGGISGLATAYQLRDL